MSHLRMAVIGVGHLGKEHARILANQKDVELVGVVDAHADTARAVAQRLGTIAYDDYQLLLRKIDAACIVVPTALHEQVASDFLSAGVPVLVEKPLAPTSAAADRLVALADKNHAVLQVGHIERFNPAFEEFCRRSLRPKYIRAERLGQFTGRSTDIGVVLDLMIHDIDLVLSLFAAPPIRLEALGMTVFGKHEDVASARLHFDEGCIVDLLASRAHPVPQRQMQIWGPEGYAGLDFGARKATLLQPSQQVRSNGLDLAALDPASRARFKEELFGRHLEMLSAEGRDQDQLTGELRDFIHCVRTGQSPRVPGHAGRAALVLAERILDAIHAHSWTNQHDAPTGPFALPIPTVPLFPHPALREAA